MNHEFRKNIHISFDKGIFLYLSILLLLIPLRLLIAVIISAVIHECFHIAAIRVMGKEIYAVNIGIRGAIIQTQGMREKEEILCAFAGPLSGLLLMLLFRWLPILALVGFSQSAYNLLPLYPTDGGRIFKSGMRLLLPVHLADRITYWMEIVTLCVIAAVCMYGAVCLQLGIIPVLFAVAFLLKSSIRK